WVTAPQEELVRQGILQLSPSAWVEIRVPEDEEEPPILLQNHPLIEPFEGVISLFSLPKYREADPNLVMGISYWILFGMMLADAGYGLVLGVLTFGLLRIYSPPEGRKSLIWMLALCSISTTIWGVLFGGYFGEALFPPLMFSPMDNPINALILCYGLGFMHILTALTMKIMGMVKQGQALDAFFDVGMWIFVLVGAVLFAVPGLAFLAPVVFGFGIAGIILTHGRSNNGIIGKLMGGLGSLYGITGYLADILSYSRLFALGLTGGVIAMVFNIIGGLILEIPAVGIPVGVILLVTLHAVNLVLSTLSSYVHTGRLQFIEFFGKFYEGGGRAFKPFAYKLKYGRLSLK
ncbi:MAG: V-type ATP synthase subunit I, partial [Symbiobacteriaceae bacterium]|nr:V-type ATP synthase subunit I [Symbiobacteriaceae bacterium]